MSTLIQSTHAMSLQDRDIKVLQGMLESRVMTSGQVASIYFDDKREAAKKRLQKLKAANYLGERKRLPNEPAVLFLTRNGISLLKEHGILTDYPAISTTALEKRSRASAITLKHELEVLEVKAKFHSAIRKSDRFSVEEFTTWTQMHQFKAIPSKYDGNEVLVKPDGFLRIQERELDGGISELTFFLEVDRSTEILDTLVAKAASYRDYYKSGGFAARHGAPRSAADQYPFRVLMVFKTSERRNNAVERMLTHNPPIFDLIFLSTLDAVLKDPLGKVWFRPRDYRDAVKDTPFGNKQEREQFGFQRQTSRDLFVEKNVRKWQIHIEA